MQPVIPFGATGKDIRPGVTFKFRPDPYGERVFKIQSVLPARERDQLELTAWVNDKTNDLFCEVAMRIHQNESGEMVCESPKGVLNLDIVG
jgi:hypothetical protein